MCYNDCVYFSFNPLTGTDKCTLPRKGICPDEYDYCPQCNAQISFDLPTCPNCGYVLDT